jgi:general secretion pathway protein G
VLAAALLLMAIAAPIYWKTARSSRQRILDNNRFTLRVAIDEFTFDKHRVPGSSRELVEAGYLRSVPLDPFTGKEIPAPWSGR